MEVINKGYLRWPEWFTVELSFQRLLVTEEEKMGSKQCQVHTLIFSHGLAEKVRI